MFIIIVAGFALISLLTGLVYFDVYSIFFLKDKIEIQSYKEEQIGNYEQKILFDKMSIFVNQTTQENIILLHKRHNLKTITNCFNTLIKNDDLDADLRGKLINKYSTFIMKLNFYKRIQSIKDAKNNQLTLFVHGFDLNNDGDIVLQFIKSFNSKNQDNQENLKDNSLSAMSYLNNVLEYKIEPLPFELNALDKSVYQMNYKIFMKNLKDTIENYYFDNFDEDININNINSIYKNYKESEGKEEIATCLTTAVSNKIDVYCVSDNLICNNLLDDCNKVSETLLSMDIYHQMEKELNIKDIFFGRVSNDTDILLMTMYNKLFACWICTSSSGEKIQSLKKDKSQFLKIQKDIYPHKKTTTSPSKSSTFSVSSSSSSKSSSPSKSFKKFKQLTDRVKEIGAHKYTRASQVQSPENAQLQ